MDAATVQDRINRGLGTAARAIGALCDAYRPNGRGAPLASGNRFLQLNVAFNAQDTRFRNAGLPADAVWYGVCDAAYLRPGDYLVERVGGRTWFVGALQALLPATCVLTNRVVSIVRPSGAAAPGIGGYGGGGGAQPLVTQYPASLLHGGNARGAEPLPADTRAGGLVALLPVIAAPAGEVIFARGDLLGDDLGRHYAIAGVERNALGWRIDLRQAAS